MTTEIVKSEDKTLVEYVPFGAQDKIKLSISIIKNLIAVKTKSGKTCTDQDAIKFMALCQARRLSPFEGDCFLIGYDGRDGTTFSLITAHQAFLKRAEVNEEYDGMKSGIIVEEDGQLKDLEGDFYTNGQKVVGGWATVYFKNRKQPMHKRIRLARFQKSFGIWQDDSAGMICKCAEADALRSSFPTMLGGLYLKEETQQTATVMAAAPIFTTPEPTVGKPEKPKVEEPAVVDVEEEKFPEPEPEKEPSKAAEPPAYNKVKAVKGLIKIKGLTEEKVLTFLRSIGTIDDETKTIEALPPEIIDLLSEQLDDISKRIK